MRLVVVVRERCWGRYVADDTVVQNTYDDDPFIIKQHYILQPPFIDPLSKQPDSVMMLVVIVRSGCWGSDVAGDAEMGIDE